MPIIDIISPNPSTILALNQQGYLISWNISAQKLAKHNIKDFPFLPHDWHEKVLEGNGIALICVSGFVVVCGEKEIKVVGVEEIGHGRVGDGKGQIGWKSVRQEDQIQSVTLINKCISTEDMQDQNNESNQKSNFTLLYSTKSGKIFYTQLTKLHPTLLCSLSQSQLPASSHAHSHSHHHSWNEYVTCMSPFRDNNLLLVGTNMGRVLIINLVSMKVVEDVSARSGVRGGFCRQIFVNDGDYRFYTVQQKGVFQWFIELLKCQGYYAYPSPYCAISTQKLSFDCQKILISGGSKQLQIIDSQDPKKRSQLQLNIECINVIKEIENKIYLGGRNNTIQVLQLGITYLILFKAEQSSFA